MRDCEPPENNRQNTLKSNASVLLTTTYIYIYILIQISGLACQQLLSSKEHKDDEEYDPLLETCTGYAYTALLKTIHPDAIPGRLLITLYGSLFYPFSFLFNQIQYKGFPNQID